MNTYSNAISNKLISRTKIHAQRTHSLAAHDVRGPRRIYDRIMHAAPALIVELELSAHTTHHMHFVPYSSPSGWNAFDLQLGMLMHVNVSLWRRRRRQNAQDYFFFDVWHTINSSPFFCFFFFNNNAVDDKLRMTFKRECRRITSTANTRLRICVIAWHEDYSTQVESKQRERGREVECIFLVV